MPKILLSILLLITLPVSQSQIGCDMNEYDFGKSSPGKTLFHTFKLSNNSESDFHIGGLSVSCSCVSAYTGRFMIKAGETIDLEVSVRPGVKPGRTEQYVYLYDSNEKLVMRFTLKYEQNNQK